MATETEEPRPHIEDQQPRDEPDEQEGGPVKPFLEHLEDLRWVLIKSLVALAVGMLICLIAGDKVVAILKHPLANAKVRHPRNVQVITVLAGTNRIGVFHLGANERAAFGLPTNQLLALQVTLKPSGSNEWII